MRAVRALSMMRAALPRTSPTSRSSCARAIFSDCVMMAVARGGNRSARAQLLFHGSAMPAARAAPRPAPTRAAPCRRTAATAGRPPRLPRRAGLSCRAAFAPRSWLAHGASPAGRARRARLASRARRGAPPLQQRSDGRAELGGRLHRTHTRGGEGGILVGCRPAAPGDDRARVPHALARRRGDAGDVGDDRLADEAADVVGSCLLVAAADLPHQDDAARARIALEQLEHIDEIHAAHRVAADADAGALTESDLGGLKHRLVGERAGARHDAHDALLVDEAGHDPDLALSGSDHAGTVGPDETRRGSRERRLDAHHVVDRYALGDAHHQLDAGIRRLEDRVGRARRRHVDHAGGGAGGTHRVPHRIEYRQAEVLLAAAAGRDAADELRAVVERGLRMKGPLPAGEPLTDDPRVAIDQDAHAVPRASATTLRAASVRSAAAVMVRPLFASSARARSALVPSSRTTTGTGTPTFFTALMMPSAMRSQRTMPPKMFTSTARTREFDRMRPNAALTRSAVAPPPTSRKFAGCPPCSLIRSMVAIASPAPFTMQAMLPSSET